MPTEVSKPPVLQSHVEEDELPLELIDDEAIRERLAKMDLRVHWWLLGLAVIVIAASAVLGVEGRESVIVPVINSPLPDLCAFKRTVGLDCPGCGLTRCFISLAHGDIASAWSFNPAGILLFGILAFQVPYRSYQVWRIKTKRDTIRLPTWIQWFLLSFAVLLIVQWVIRLCLGML